jgi:CRP/FNR family transcriptional regulator, cyclic AMP receptor protein
VATTSDQIVDLLRGVPAFTNLTEEDLERVVEVAVPRRFDTGEIVFRESDEGDTCYVVRDGRARAIRSHPDGRSITLADFGPGDIFGELAMFDREPRSATVEVLEATELIAILGADMRRLMSEHPSIAVKLIASLAERLRATNERLARQSFQTVQSRLAGLLTELVQRADPSQGGGEVTIVSTQADLAQLAGCSRESTSRFLAELARAGIISQRRGKLVVHDPVALEGYVY